MRRRQLGADSAATLCAVAWCSIFLFDAPPAAVRACNVDMGTCGASPATDGHGQKHLLSARVLSATRRVGGSDIAWTNCRPQQQRFALFGKVHALRGGGAGGENASVTTEVECSGADANGHMGAFFLEYANFARVPAGALSDSESSCATLGLTCACPRF